jgi:segregation and condensation protein B
MSIEGVTGEGSPEDVAEQELADGSDRPPINALSLTTPDVKLIVEGALLAAGGPLTLDQILSLYPEERRPTRDEIRAAAETLAVEYEGRGVELVEVAGGWRVQVRRAVAPWVARLWEEKPVRYSRALLETLALIAYRQPITRGEIEEIRGVAVSTQIVKTLTEREWVRVVGHRDVPGRPALFATTRRFLDYFGLRSLNDLPPLAELRDPAFFGDQLAAVAAEMGVEPDQGSAGEQDSSAAVAQATLPNSEDESLQSEPAVAASPDPVSASDPTGAPDDDQPR